MLETVTGGILMCVGGESTLLFDALPEINVLVQGMPAGKILDMIPYVNLVPTGICALLTAEGGGLPVPCMPSLISPWMIGDPTVLIDGLPALDNLSFIACSHGGLISIMFPNNETTWLAL